jgi:hypothetical protein
VIRVGVENVEDDPRKLGVERFRMLLLVGCPHKSVVSTRRFEVEGGLTGEAALSLRLERRLRSTSAAEKDLEDDVGTTPGVSGGGAR